MWKATVKGVRLPENFTSEYRARVAATEFYTESLKDTTEGGVRYARLRGKTIGWPEISARTVIEVIVGEWVPLDGPDHHPEENFEEPGSVVFIDRRKLIRRLGCYVNGVFYDEQTGKEFPFERVAEYFILPESLK